LIRIFSRYVSPKSVLLGGMEGGFIVLGLLFGARLRFWGAPSEFSEYIRAPGFAFQAAFFVVTLQLCFYYSDLYDWTSVRNRWQQLISVGQSIGAACLFLGIMYFAFPMLLIGRGVFFISTMLVAIFALMARMALDAVWILAAPKQRVMIIGTGKAATTVRQEIVRRSDLNVEVVGFLESNGGGESTDPQVLGTTRD
jgi:FlaA1/EpsC-like NDP-sugar epimerase